VLWTGLPLFRLWGALIYGVAGLALWHAPIYAWLLLVSGWAKRSTFLFAVLPPLALCLVEKIAFDTAVAWSLLKDRLFGFAFHGFDVEGPARPHPIRSRCSPRRACGSDSSSRSCSSPRRSGSVAIASRSERCRDRSARAAGRQCPGRDREPRITPAQPVEFAIGLGIVADGAQLHDPLDPRLGRGRLRHAADAGAQRGRRVER